jgi:cobalamin biosynthesis protein CobD/CbiB
MMADRQQIFDKERIRHRWSTASWGRRIATVLAIPVGMGLGYLLTQAQESGAVPETVIRVLVLVLMIFAVRRLAKSMKDERNREDP